MLDPLLGYTRRKLESAIREAEIAIDAEATEPHATAALQLTKELLEARLAELAKISSKNDPDVVRTMCSEASLQIVLYLPLIGFFRSSTDVRNAFELNGPLLTLAENAVGPPVRLILSPTWDYSPFTYRPIDGLTDFVLIGLPASEADNALVLPCAGHELGHTLWVRVDFRLRTKLRDALLNEIRSRWTEYQRFFPKVDIARLEDLIGQSTWNQPYEWALAQLEEVFCDVVGVYLFSEAYLSAFAYLLAPNLGSRSPRYPRMTSRVEYIQNAASAFGTTVEKDYGELFCDEDPGVFEHGLNEFWCSVSDDAVKTLVPDVIQKIQNHLATTPTRTAKQVEEICRCFRLRVPSNDAETLSDIVNAGWKVSRQGATDPEMLNDLVLKSIEVLQYNSLLRKPDAATLGSSRGPA